MTYILIILIINLILSVFLLIKSKMKINASDISLTISSHINDRLDTLNASIDTKFETLNTKNIIFQKDIIKELELIKLSTLESLNKLNLEEVKNLNELKDNLDTKFSSLVKNLNENLNNLRHDNNIQLDKIRKTVDEELQGSLEKKLNLSFQAVQKQLESVYKGLGEMHTLAQDVGSLSKVFSNVKSRGVWGEVTLKAILDDILTPNQYVINYSPKKKGEFVEFAIKMPGKDNDVYLPIDSKFPKEDYEKLLIAEKNSDMEAVKSCLKNLKARIIAEAKNISSKYINPPYTTDFALLFLPTESLFAEVLSFPGVSEEILTKYKVSIIGPTTTAAFVNSLQMGFKTLAIEKRTNDVWKIFASLQKDFMNLSSLIESAVKSLDTTTNKMEIALKKSSKLVSSLSRLELPEGVTEDEDINNILSVDV